MVRSRACSLANPQTSRKQSIPHPPRHTPSQPLAVKLSVLNTCEDISNHRVAMASALMSKTFLGASLKSAVPANGRVSSCLP